MSFGERVVCRRAFELARTEADPASQRGSSLATLCLSFLRSKRADIHSDVIENVISFGGSMRNLFCVLLLSALARPLFAQGAPPQAAAGQPYTIEYYYKVQWGHQQEFLQLFLKNHYPLLKKMWRWAVFCRSKWKRPPITCPTNPAGITG